MKGKMDYDDRCRNNEIIPIRITTPRPEFKEYIGDEKTTIYKDLDERYNDEDFPYHLICNICGKKIDIDDKTMIVDLTPFCMEYSCGFTFHVDCILKKIKESEQ